MRKPLRLPISNKCKVAITVSNLINKIVTENRQIYDAEGK